MEQNICKGIAPQYVGLEAMGSSMGQWSPAVVDRRSISPPEKRGL